MSNLEDGFNIIEGKQVEIRMASLEKSFLDGKTSFYFEPHAERWYVTPAEAANIIRGLADFIAANVTVPVIIPQGDHFGLDAEIRIVAN